MFYGPRRYGNRAYNTHTSEKGFTWVNNTIIKELNSSFAQMAEDLANVSGKQIEYMYDAPTLDKMVKSGALGYNKFMYTVKE